MGKKNSIGDSHKHSCGHAQSPSETTGLGRESRCWAQSSPEAHPSPQPPRSPWAGGPRGIRKCLGSLAMGNTPWPKPAGLKPILVPEQAAGVVLMSSEVCWPCLPKSSSFLQKVINSSRYVKFSESLQFPAKHFSLAHFLVVILCSRGDVITQPLHHLQEKRTLFLKAQTWNYFCCFTPGDMS